MPDSIPQLLVANNYTNVQTYAKHVPAAECSIYTDQPLYLGVVHPQRG